MKLCPSRSRLKETTLFDQDDHLRPETTMEGLAKLRRLSARTVSSLPENASASDGAAALVIADEKL